jgi:cytidylate kinase
MDVKLKNNRVVAIDGGTATGKGRLIEELAQLLRLKGVPVMHLSTGSIYRTLSYVAIDAASEKVPGRRDLSATELAHEALEFVKQMTPEELLELVNDRQVELHGGQVWLDGAPMTEEQLKGPAVGMGASVVGIHLEVRQWEKSVVRRQVNEFDGYLLIDGRDITHETVPEAPLKLLLTVSPQVAAQRSREHTMEQIVERDERDRKRKHGALKHPDDPGPGVLVLATDDHTPESVRDHVYGLMRRVFEELPELEG